MSYFTISSIFDKNSKIDLKAATKCAIKKDTGLVVDEASNRLPAKAVKICKVTPFIITEERDIDYLADSEMETIYQAEDQYFEFLEK